MNLAQVTEAAERRTEADHAYRSAVLQSVKANGISRTATAAGVSRQAVAQLVKRALSEQDAPAAKPTGSTRRSAIPLDAASVKVYCP